MGVYFSLTPEKQDRIKAFICFAGLNYVLTLLIGLGYFTRPDLSPLSLMFGTFAWVSTAFLIYLPLVAAGAILISSSLLDDVSYYFAATAGDAGKQAFSSDFFRPVEIPSAVFFAVLQLLMVLDMLIFRMYGFHINHRVVRLALNPEGVSSLDINFGLIVLLLFIVAVLFVIERYFCLQVFKIGRVSYSKGRIVMIGLVLFLAVIGDKGLSVYGMISDNQQIVGNFVRFPKYWSVPQRLFVKDADIFPDLHFGNQTHVLNYPVQPIAFTQYPRPNIIFLAIDSYRSDMVNYGVSPNISAFSKKAAVFQNHYSGGNNTRDGIFTLFYGLLPNYWQSVLNEKRAPVFFDLLKAKGYDIRIYTGTGISYPELDRTCFVSIPKENIYEGYGNRKSDRDADINKKFIEFLGSRKQSSKKPFFAFIFYDSTHAAYDFPDADKKFVPSAGYFNYLSLSSGNILPVFNKYRNAAHYCDRLAEEIFTQLERLGYMDNSIVLITGDHGEAFFEKGYAVHSFGYTKEELKVPLIVRLPGGVHKEISRLTSHLDVVPTIMEQLGVKNGVVDYSSGLDLFKDNARKYVPVFDWHDRRYGFIDKEGSTFISPGGTVRRLRFFDKEYRLVHAPDTISPYREFLYGFQRETMRFWRGRKNNSHR